MGLVLGVVGLDAVRLRVALRAEVFRGLDLFAEVGVDLRCAAVGVELDFGTLGALERLVQVAAQRVGGLLGAVPHLIGDVGGRGRPGHVRVARAHQVDVVDVLVDADQAPGVDGGLALGARVGDVGTLVALLAAAGLLAPLVDAVVIVRRRLAGEVPCAVLGGVGEDAFAMAAHAKGHFERVALLAGLARGPAAGRRTVRARVVEPSGLVALGAVGNDVRSGAAVHTAGLRQHERGGRGGRAVAAGAPVTLVVAQPTRQLVVRLRAVLVERGRQELELSRVGVVRVADGLDQVVVPLLLRELDGGALLERDEGAVHVLEVLLERGLGPDQRRQLLALQLLVAAVARRGAALVEE